MKLRIKEMNRLSIEAALDEARGKSHKHVWRKYEEVEGMAEDLEARLEDYGLPKSHRAGAYARVYSVDPRDFANSYNNRVNVTMASFLRTPSGWALTRAEGGSVWVGSACGGQIREFVISREQAMRSDAAWRRALKISLRAEPEMAK